MLAHLLTCLSLSLFTRKKSFIDCLVQQPTPIDLLTDSSAAFSSFLPSFLPVLSACLLALFVIRRRLTFAFLLLVILCAFSLSDQLSPIAAGRRAFKRAQLNSAWPLYILTLSLDPQTWRRGRRNSSSRDSKARKNYIDI